VSLVRTFAKLLLSRVADLARMELVDPFDRRAQSAPSERSHQINFWKVRVCLHIVLSTSSFGLSADL